MLGRDAWTSGPLGFTLHLLTRQPACFLFLLRDRAARSDLPPANACHRHQGRVFHPAALTATMMAFFVSLDAAPRPDTAWCQRPPCPCANTLGERLQVGTVTGTCQPLLSSLGFLPQSPSSEHETTKSIPLILGSGLSIPVILGSGGSSARVFLARFSASGSREHCATASRDTLYAMGRTSTLVNAPLLHVPFDWLSGHLD